MTARTSTPHPPPTDRSPRGRPPTPRPVREPDRSRTPQPQPQKPQPEPHQRQPRPQRQHPHHPARPAVRTRLVPRLFSRRRAHGHGTRARSGRRIRGRNQRRRPATMTVPVVVRACGGARVGRPYAGRFPRTAERGGVRRGAGRGRVQRVGRLSVCGRPRGVRRRRGGARGRLGRRRGARRTRCRCRAKGGRRRAGRGRGQRLAHRAGRRDRGFRCRRGRRVSGRGRRRRAGLGGRRVRGPAGTRRYQQRAREQHGNPGADRRTYRVPTPRCPSHALRPSAALCVVSESHKATTPASGGRYPRLELGSVNPSGVDSETCVVRGAGAGAAVGTGVVTDLVSHRRISEGHPSCSASGEHRPDRA